jgi:light-regulated signal transduction histidine kinase (bacteriophytochrome)
MDYEKKSKKGRKKANKDLEESNQTENILSITREKLKNYFGLEVAELSKENLEKFSLYIDKYESTLRLKESKNLSELHETCLSNVK